MRSAATIAAAALLSGTADAFWRMPCHARTALARLDPIVDRGTASSHAHTIHGGSNFDESTTYEGLRNSECTSCQFSDDKSAYWTPSLHFVHAGGKTEIVPQIGGMLAYYMLIGEDIKAFPKGFQMLAGDSRMRNFTGEFPDPPTSAWGPEDKTQEALMQKSLGFNCMNYGRKPEGSRYRHFMPDKQYLDDNCASGIRAEIFFPSCWNGKDTTSKDHKSHVAYPDMIDGGVCPEGFPVRLPSLFYETIWNTDAFNGKPGQFVWANGDPTGYGYHADFMNGWNIDTLQSAIDTCTSLSGRVEDCPIFTPSLQSEFTQGMCEIQAMPDVLKNDDCAGPAKGLCGNVEVQYGPGYANPLQPGAPAGKPTVAPILSSVAPVPTQSYAPAKSEGPGGVSKFDVKPSASPAPAPAKPAYEAAVPAPAAPVVTPIANIADAVDDKANIISTSTYTKDGIVYEVAIEEVAVTVTVTESAAMKHKRHADAHRRARKGVARR